MPKKAHAALKKSAKKKGLTGDRRNAFIYGTLNKKAKSTKKKKIKKKT